MITEQAFSLVPAGSINVNVNPLMNKPEELLWARNVYSPRFGRKRVRFGYQLFLDNPDSKPIRNLIFFDFPNGRKGILRYSGGKLYRYSFTGSSWGSPINTLTTNPSLFNKVLGHTQMLSKLHISSQALGIYQVYDGNTFTILTSSNTPYADYLTNWRGRIFAGKYTVSSVNFYSRLKYSSVDFGGTDPWQEDDTDPSSSGSMSVGAGVDGIITGLSIIGDRPYYFKEQASYKFNGTGVIRDPLGVGAFPNSIATVEDTTFYFNNDGVYFNNGSQHDLASFKIQPIIQKTYDMIGFDKSKICAVGWKWYYMLYVDRIYWNNKIYSNAMLVYDKRFDEWYVWTLGHRMTCFSWFVDPTTNDKILISGDEGGNTYIWGNGYNSDAGKPIVFEIQGVHHPLTNIQDDKRLVKTYTISDFGDEANLYLIYDKTRDPVEIDFATGFMKSKEASDDNLYDFKTVSYLIKGSTTSNRGSIDGIILKVSLEGEQAGSERI